MVYKISVTKKKIGTSLSAHVGVDPEVDYELGVFFGSKIDELTEAGRNKIMTLSSKNHIFAWSLGHGAGLKFKKNSPEVRNWILGFADKSPYFSGGLGHGLSRHIRKLATSNSLEPIIDACKIIYPNNKTHYLAFEFIEQNKLIGNQIFDAYLAATAISNDVTTIATDNVKDFKKFGINLFNPFTE